jgi:hypothetical protein
MKVLQNIKTDLIVAIDIETVRLADKFEELDEGTQSAWEYKNKFEGEIPDYDKLCELWEKNSALYAEFSKICAVSISFLHEGLLYCREFFGKDEKAILEQLAISLNNMQVKNTAYRLVGHASKYFDYPSLCKRYIINELDIPNVLDTTALKPWEGMNLCTNELWKVGGTGAGSSLQALCNALQIPTSKTDLVGDEVGRAYFKGELARIGRYCSQDSVATFNIIRKFKKEDIFYFDFVNFVSVDVDNKNTEKEVVEELPLLQRIFTTKDLSKDDKEELLQLLKKKKITKKDKEKVLDLIGASLADIDSNFGAVKNQNQIDEIINQLKEEI